MNSRDWTCVDPDIQSLPRWARAAFAVQCSQAAYFLTPWAFDDHPSPSGLHLQIFDMLERTCEGKLISMEVIDKVYVFIQMRSNLARESFTVDSSTGELALSALRAAAESVELALQGVDDTQDAALACYDYAIEAIGNRPGPFQADAISSILRQLLMLSEASRLESWTNETRVASQFFGTCRVWRGPSPEKEPDRYPDRVTFELCTGAGYDDERRTEAFSQFIRCLALLMLSYGMKDFTVVDTVTFTNSQEWPDRQAHIAPPSCVTRFAIRSFDRSLLQSVRLAVEAGTAESARSEPAQGNDTVSEAPESADVADNRLQDLANQILEKEVWDLANNLRKQGIDRSRWPGGSARSICQRRYALITWLHDMAGKGVLFRVL